MKFTYKENNFKFIEARPKPTNTYLKNFYKKIYFNKKVSSTYNFNYSLEELNNRNMRSDFYIKIAKNILKKKKPKFLYILAGEGFLLNSAFKHRFDFLGVDFQSNQMNKFHPHLMKNFVKSDPEKFLVKINNNSYDIIASQFVLEHLKHPVNFMNNIKKKLKKNGILIISIPNDFKEFQKLLLKEKLVEKKYWFSPPQHLNYFNNKNISFFFTKLRLNIIEAVSDFPIEIFLSLNKSNYVNNKKKGKDSHNARLMIDNFILSQKYDKALNFYKACLDCGLGRSMTFFLKKK